MEETAYPVTSNTSEEVAMSTPTTTVILEPMPTSNKQGPPRPQTWLPFTVFVTLCCCVLFGVLARRSGAQVLYHHERKQYAAAKKASRQALKYNIAGVIGGILIWIVVLGSADLYGPAEVLNVQPWTKSDLHVQPFSNKVRDLPELIYLFPTTPKGDAFGDFYQHHQNPPTTNGMGYIAASIVTVIHSEPNSIAGNMYSPTPPSPYSQRIDSPFSNAPPTPLESQLPLDMQLPRVPGSNPPLPSFDDI